MFLDVTMRMVPLSPHGSPLRKSYATTTKAEKMEVFAVAPVATLKHRFSQRCRPILMIPTVLQSAVLIINPGKPYQLLRRSQYSSPVVESTPHPNKLMMWLMELPAELKMPPVYSSMASFASTPQEIGPFINSACTVTIKYTAKE